MNFPWGKKPKLAETATDPEILSQLSHDEDYLLRCYVAQNPTLQPTLEFLSTQEKIRLAETSNDPKILDSLAQDKNSDVRWRVLLNSNTSSLTKLSITF